MAGSIWTAHCPSVTMKVDHAHPPHSPTPKPRRKRRPCRDPQLIRQWKLLERLNRAPATVKELIALDLKLTAIMFPCHRRARKRAGGTEGMERYWAIISCVSRRPSP